MATIRKRQLPSGEVVWELTHGSGRDRQRFTVGRTREEAEGALTHFKRQLVLHGNAPTELTIPNAVAEYNDYIKHNRRASTAVRYVQVLRVFTICFLSEWYPGVERLREIKPLHIEEFKRRRAAGEIRQAITTEEKAREEELRAELALKPACATPKQRGKYGWLGRRALRTKVNPRTVNYELQALTTFCQWAIRRNYLFVNPVKSVEKFRIPKRAMPKFLTSEELKKFFGSCNEKQRRLFGAILLSGMRKGEVEHLTWNDVSFELGVIFIQEKPEFDWQPKTDERLVPISPILNDLLSVHYANRVSDTLVFPNDSGNIDTHILETLKRICRKAGIKQSTVHALRHSFGAHLRMAGVNLADIADLLGHKNLATTQIYARVHQEHLRAAVGKLTPLVPMLSVDAQAGRAPQMEHEHGTSAQTERRTNVNR